MKKVKEEKYYNFLNCFRMPVVRTDEYFELGNEHPSRFTLKIQETGEPIAKYECEGYSNPKFFIDTDPVIKYLKNF
jgi:hypothetical protein